MNPSLIIFISTIAIIISWCSLLDWWQYRKDKEHEVKRNEDESENP